MWFMLFVLSLAWLSSQALVFRGQREKFRGRARARGKEERTRDLLSPMARSLARPTKNKNRHLLRRLSPAVPEGFSLSTSDFPSSHIRTFSNFDGHFRVIQSFLMKTVESLHNAVNDLDTAFYWSLLLSLNVTLTFCHSSL